VNPSNLHVFVASEKYESDLLEEIKYRGNLDIVKNENGILWVKGSKQVLWWPQWQLWNIQTQSIDSISHASKILKTHGKYWINLEYKLHRRSSLIQESLIKAKIPLVKRGYISDFVKCGAWFLENANQISFTDDISIPFKNGIPTVPEDKSAPSRAFQKLDEVFARIGRFPSKEEKVMDLGSHPGGWTWVLSHLAKSVVSIDTVALDEKVGHQKNVEFIKKDAFKLLPTEIGKVDWFFSDIICEPERLYALVNEWRDLGLVKNFICTIKFKGAVDFNVLKKFQAIPNSEIFHLNANKHELTWTCLDKN
jgi:23S rRNA (cytidine2498-2'-O)-methyltransferase